jgi:hypothetical protein
VVILITPVWIFCWSNNSKRATGQSQARRRLALAAGEEIFRAGNNFFGNLQSSLNERKS